MDRCVKNKNLHKCGMTRLQLNSSSPTLLNCRILELLVLNGKGLEKDIPYLWSFTKTTFTIPHSQPYNNLGLCLLKIKSLIILQAGNLFCLFDKFPTCSNLRFPLILLTKRHLWLVLLAEKIIKDTRSKKRLSSSQSNENMEGYPTYFLQTKLVPTVLCHPFLRSEGWRGEERALGTS